MTSHDTAVPLSTSAHRGALALLSFLLLLLAGSPAHSQTGLPPFGSFSGTPDEVNLANLNVHWSFPVVNKAGRSSGLNFNLSYDSTIWFYESSWGLNIFPGNNGGDAGWNYGAETLSGYVLSAIGSCSGGTKYYNYVYYDVSKTAHPFPNASWCSGGGGQLTDTANDGSGYYISINGTSGQVSVTDPGGVVRTVTIYPNASFTTFNPAIYDTNGNVLSLTKATTGCYHGDAACWKLTDTLGTNALTFSPEAPPTNGAVPTRYFTYTSPSGSAVDVVVTYGAYMVKPNFGCTGIGDGAALQTYLVNRITYPDGSYYAFTYEPTPGYAGDVTARITSVRIPTGGTVSYSYTGGNNGIVCADGTTAGLTRTTPDGTWTYTRSGSGSAWTTTATDPAGNVTVHNFQGLYETEHKAYQGSTTLLRDTTICYNGNLSNCNTTAVALPITRKTVTTTVGTLTSKVDTFFDANGSMTEKDEYDYGASSPTRKTLITYNTALSNHIVSRPATVTVQNSAGQNVSQTSYSYDQTAVTPTSGTPQLITITGSRGNATTVSSGGLSTTYAYFDTGKVQTKTDVNGAQYSYTYGGCGNSFPTAVSEPLGLSSSTTWNCTGGVAASRTDENGQTVNSVFNDPYFWRVNQLQDQLGNTAYMTYTSPTQYSASMSFNAGTSVNNGVNTFDSLGRGHLAQAQQAPGSANYDSTEVDYAWASTGRQVKKVLPFSATLGGTNPSGSGTTTTYDSLGRPLSVSDSGGLSAAYTYSLNDVLSAVGPAPSGENSKKRQKEYNAFGWLTSVCEITSNQPGGGSACNQDTAATGFKTSYTYDALGHLTQVNQSGQTRSYGYDALGRVTSETTPETGTINYQYDTACYSWQPSSAGDLMCKYSPMYITEYTYDKLHRLTDVGPNDWKICTRLRYDTASNGVLGSAPSGITVNNGKGRLIEAETDNCATPITASSIITDEWFSYDAKGEVTDVWQSMWGGTSGYSGSFYHSSASYFANGVVNALNPLNNTSVLPTFTFSLDGEGRPNAIGASSGTNPVLSSSYNVAGRLTGVTLGSYDSETFQYDANTGRMTQYQSSVGATPKTVTGALTWNANGSLSQLSITDQFNSADTQTCNYAHDDLSRLSSANCGSLWSQTFSYDTFGNLKKSGSVSFQPSYSSATNQMTSITGCTPTYDANGNTTYDCLHRYNWDAYGHLSGVDISGSCSTAGSCIIYDALGRMVAKTTSGGTEQFLYGPGGAKLATMTGQTVVKAFIGNAVYTAAGLNYFRHLDWLGSSRFGSTPNRQMQYSQAYAPFGEIYAQAGTPDNLFTGDGQDIYSSSTSGLYDFAAREYAQYGRWISPDPAGIAATNLSNPQSLNRYVYVGNSPVMARDPSGLCYDGCSGWEGDIFPASYASYFDAADVGNGADAQRLIELDLLFTPDLAYGTEASALSDSIPMPAPSVPDQPIQGQPDTSSSNPVNGFIAESILSAVPASSGTGFTGLADLPTPGSRLANGDVAVGGDFLRNSTQCPTCGTIINSAATWVNAAAVGTGAVLVGVPLAGEFATSAAGDFLFARGGTGLLNANDFFRIGWGWYEPNIIDFLPVGGEVFRVVIGSPNGPIHWHLWP